VSLAERLTRLRTRLSLHPREMAEKMGVTERVYRKYEKQEQVPGSDKIIHLLNDLKDINPTWLMLGEGEIFRSNVGTQWKYRQQEEEANALVGDIIMMLNDLDQAAIRDIQSVVSEKKKLKQMENMICELQKKFGEEEPESP
jgi:transcriptional regulator with XRE-family HTH domain